MSAKRVCIKDQVLLNNGLKGQVRFIGSIPGKKSIYYGVALTGQGKNDGRINGIKYFSCKKNHGLFVNAAKISKSKASKVSHYKSLPRVSVGDTVHISHLNIEGVLRFIGDTHFDSQRVWYGVELFKPQGNHNGTVDDRTYFQSKPRHGIFLCGDEIEAISTNSVRKKRKRKKESESKLPTKSTCIRLHLSHSDNAMEEPPRPRPIDRYQIETNRKRCAILSRAYCSILQSNLPNDQYDKSQLKSSGVYDFIAKLLNQYLLQNVSSRDFERIRNLGKGGFAAVKLVKFTQNEDENQLFAMKSVSKKMVKKKKMQKQIILERDVLLHLNHPLIVNLFWTFHDDTYFYFIQEFCSGGDLMNVLIERETLSETLTKRYISELAMAIHAVHKAGYIHRDIKPENLLLTASGHIKLCDFGSAARFEGKCLFEILGTPDYVAPEMLERSGYGPKVDWWALGIVLFQCLCGYTPFAERNPKQTCRNILNYSRMLMITTHTALSATVKDCVKQLICDERLRMGFAEIKGHALFDGVKWRE